MANTFKRYIELLEEIEDTEARIVSLDEEFDYLALELSDSLKALYNELGANQYSTYEGQ